MISLRYTIKLLEPLLATALQSDPNSAVSYPFIPGSLIRGAVIGKYLAASPTQDLAVNPEARRRFLDGSTRFLNAYLLGENDTRTLPTPLSWYRDKSAKLDEGYTIVDKAHPDFDSESEEFEKIGQPKAHEPKFFVAEDDTVTLYDSARQINIHTRRENRTAGRATDDDRGAVFRYDALAAGQSFGGVILCDTDSDADVFFEILNTAELVIGGSRSGGYGRVRITHIEKDKNWYETTGVRKPIAADSVFTVTLTADVILRDENGQFTDTLSAKTLARALGIAETALIPQKTYRQMATVGGFNRKWGLPLPQNLAIRAGSVFTFKTTVGIPATAIEQLHWRGLGERRAEGFGRVAVNLFDRETLRAQAPSPQSALLEKPKLDAASQKLARQMNRRLFRRNADRALARAVNNSKIFSPPKRSQLGGLRVEIRRALQGRDTASVENYLREMKSTAQKQFENARVRGFSSHLHEWLLQQLENPDDIWQQLEMPNTNPLHLDDATAVSQSEMAVEYTLRFIDAVLAKASKEAKND